MRNRFLRGGFDALRSTPRLWFGVQEYLSGLRFRLQIEGSGFRVEGLGCLLGCILQSTFVSAKAKNNQKTS
jgi:type VI protein secretion system component VasA